MLTQAAAFSAGVIPALASDSDNAASALRAENRLGVPGKRRREFPGNT